jgi:hypothetical protein
VSVLHAAITGPSILDVDFNTSGTISLPDVDIHSARR